MSGSPKSPKNIHSTGNKGMVKLASSAWAWDPLQALRSLIIRVFGGFWFLLLVPPTTSPMMSNLGFFCWMHLHFEFWECDTKFASHNGPFRRAIPDPVPWVPLWPYVPYGKWEILYVRYDQTSSLKNFLWMPSWSSLCSLTNEARIFTFLKPCLQSRAKCLPLLKVFLPFDLIWFSPNS